MACLSQYPDEIEFLYPPLCGLEARADPTVSDGVITYEMDFHTNNTICSADGASASAEIYTSSLPDLLHWLPAKYLAEAYVALPDSELLGVLKEQGMSVMDSNALVPQIREWVGRRRTLHLPRRHRPEQGNISGTCRTCSPRVLERGPAKIEWGFCFLVGK